MRDAPSLHYYEVHAGFVHHTVNANDYTRAQVPSIIRGIYAYHTRSQGWSDIGYNFLVDKFGRVWEGRYGGVNRPVVGAHTLGYNDNAFAASAIGNFETARPSRAMIRAYGRLFAWKLSLHGVNAADGRQYVTSDYFKAINGHRDAGATACPGINLYNRIPRIRELATAAQQGWGGRELESSLVSSARPDLVLRRAVDGKVFVRQVVPTDSGYRLGKRVSTGLLLPERRPDHQGRRLGPRRLRRPHRQERWRAVALPRRGQGQVRASRPGSPGASVASRSWPRWATSPATGGRT